MNYGYNFNPVFMRSAMPMTMAAPSSGLSSLFAPSAIGNAASASKFTFSGLLNGASKTLGVINQAIPVFYQVKPIWNNAKTMMRVVKGINSNDTKNSINNTNNSISKKEEQSNAPTFFA